MEDGPIPDFVELGDRFILAFDPAYDTLESIRSRSSFLFNAICAIGCAVKNEEGSRLPQRLNLELKKCLNVVFLRKTGDLNLEAVQALQVVSCYSTDRTILISFANRIAMDLGIPYAYEQLIKRLIQMGDQVSSPDANGLDIEYSLMRKTRTWFSLMILDQLSRLYQDKWRDFTFDGDARRCRTLLNHGFLTRQDLRLLSQVELLVLQAKLSKTFADAHERGQEMMNIARNCRLDLDIWYDDWARIMESSAFLSPETPSMLVGLQMQRSWTEVMCLCRAIRSTGIEDITAMPAEERELLEMAKKPLKEHQMTMCANVEHYLCWFRHAIDYVWAKCTFSFLLGLKIRRLLPDTDEDSLLLLSQGRDLLLKLQRIGTIGGGSNSKSYLHVFHTTIEKYWRSLGQQQIFNDSAASTSPDIWQVFDAQLDLDLFIPEQFVLEWDFPGLTLFESPSYWVDFLDEVINDS
ncbi:hypothetical protein N7493_000939 [Penicillium malachiteum]|uniref:C6 zinc finger domain protein n=1 Tax=Penicillium malachiteum TaxID=1324776 RepID=A0AAD6HXL7_9EURO|nr:hypothetical protein N7493_000939 [Penicillium malachiteum]